MRILRSIPLLAACWLAIAAPSARADEFSAVEHQRTTIYHSPQTPGFTSWCGAWTMPDGSLMTSFTQATGPVEGRPKGPADALRRLNWPPEGHPGYDMTGLDLRNIHLRSTDSGQTWKQVSADPFKTCMNGITGMAEVALADGTVIRAVEGFQLPYNPELPQTGFLQRSLDGTQSWGKPELTLDPEKFTTIPKRLRLLKDGRLLLLGGFAPVPANSLTRHEYTKVLQPLIQVSADNGKTWSERIEVVPAEHRPHWGGEEFDAAELSNGDLLCVFRRLNPDRTSPQLEVRWQEVLKKSGKTWETSDAGPAPFPHSGHPELLATREGAILHLATSGIHWTTDAGATWHKLDVAGTAYYPRSVQAADGRIFIFGHVGGDDAYGKSDQSIVMDSFLLKPATTAASWKMHNVRRLAGGATEQHIPARLQIMTENWDRPEIFAPFIVYMPEKDRLLMLASRGMPRLAVVMSSDDHGTTWSEPRSVFPSDTPISGHLIGVSLTYLGGGKVLAGAEGKHRLFSADYGETWSAAPIPPLPGGGAWNQWDPYLVERDARTGTLTRLMETGYDYQQERSQAFLRSSTDGGTNWSPAARIPQWEGVNEVALLRAANGHLIAACRTDMPEKFKGGIDHHCGLGISISTDVGATWSALQKLFDWGRHHPSLLLLPSGDIVMTYVVRKGYVDDPDGFPQFGVEAVVSRDHGQTWDLDHRYILHHWVGHIEGARSWTPSSQATSTVQLPDGSILTAFGTGYRCAADRQVPQDLGLLQWKLSKEPIRGETRIQDAAVDSDLRNWLDPLTGSPISTLEKK